MTDIVERLRTAKTWPVPIALLQEAADEIERLKKEHASAVYLIRHMATECHQLEAEIERLRAALQPFAEAYDALMQQDELFPRYHSIDTARLREARRALEPKP